MKRPLIGFTAAFAVAIYLQLHAQIWDLLRVRWFAGGSIGLFWLALCVVFPKIRVGLVILAGGMCGILFANGYTTHVVQPLTNLAGTTMKFAGIVQEEPSVYTDCQRMVVKVEAQSLGIASAYPRALILLYAPLTEVPIQPGDTIETTARLYEPQISDGFDKASFFHAKGIFLLAKDTSDNEKTVDTASEFTVAAPERASIWYMPLRARQTIKTTLQAQLRPRIAGFVTAILFGDKTTLDATDYMHLRKAGLAHLAAASGLHVGFLVSFLVLFLGRKYGSGVAMLCIILFLPMAGMTPSVIRAGIMYLMVLVAFYLERENSSLNSLCFALLLLVCSNPYAIDSLSLQLSFAASLGLVLFAHRIQNFISRWVDAVPAAYFRKLLRFFSESITASMCALLFTIPICMMSFGYVSLLSPVANLLVVGIVGCIFVLGLLVGSVGAWIPVVGHVLGTVLDTISQYVLVVAEKISAFPYGILYSDTLYAWCAIGLFYLLGVTAWKLRKKKWMYPCVSTLGIALLIVLTQNAAVHAKSMEIHILPCGTGQAILVVSDKHDVTLIDCSASGYRNAAELVQNSMDWYGYDEIDTLILTSVDKTHARNVPELLAAVPVHQIIIPNENRKSETLDAISAAATEKNIPVTQWTAGADETTVGTGISILGGIARKLMVRLQKSDGNYLVLHSVTQKMLQTYLETHAISADTVVLAESNIADAALLHAALDQIKPHELVLESGYGAQERILQYSVRNTYLEGEILVKLT